MDNAQATEHNATFSQGAKAIDKVEYFTKMNAIDPQTGIQSPTPVFYDEKGGANPSPSIARGQSLP